MRTAAANVITNNYYKATSVKYKEYGKIPHFFLDKLSLSFFSLKDVNEVITSATGTGGAAGGVTCNNINHRCPRKRR